MRLIIALLIGLISNLQAAVHTDTHTYIVSKGNNRVLVIDRMTGKKKFIKVDKAPHSMVIHQNFGYVSNKDSAIISIIDLQTRTVTKTIAVGNNPTDMIIHGDFGYVVNIISDTISVIDLKTQRLLGELKGLNSDELDFSDTSIYLGIKKFRPFYTTIDSI